MAKFFAQNEYEKEFFKLFESLCMTRSSWRVWSDFITVSAISLSNAFEMDSERKAAREQEYVECIKRLGEIDKAAELLGVVVKAFEENPAKDFLGGLFIKLGLNNHWRGQFFTPYHICEFMAQIALMDANEEIASKGYASICDCACGAGAMLIAAANVLRANKINYQTQALFVAQDIDRIAGLMCYIQLSLLGCPGYVVIGDSIANPVVGELLMPFKMPGQELWYLPMYFSPYWIQRRLCRNSTPDRLD